MVVTMIKQLTKHGNSLALIIDKSILEILKIRQNTMLELTTDGNSLTITPVDNAEHVEKFQNAVALANEKYAITLKKLAE